MSNIWNRPWINKFTEANRPNPGALAYRYVDRHGTDFYTDVDGEARPCGRYVEIVLETFAVLRYTPKGFWIVGYDGEKFIAHGWRKKYAHLNLDEARKAFKLRKTRQLHILKGQLERVSQVVESIEADKWSGRCPMPAFKLVRKLA